MRPRVHDQRTRQPTPTIDVDRVRSHFDFPCLGRIVTNNAASTQPPRELAALVVGLTKSYEDVHRGQSVASRQMTELFEASCDTFAQWVNAPSRRSIATYRNTTEAINVVMYPLLTDSRDGDNVVTTMLEHNSDFVPWDGMCRTRSCRASGDTSSAASPASSIGPASSTWTTAPGLVEGLISRKGEFMPAPRKYPQELRDRSVRLVNEATAAEPELSLNAAVKRIAPRMGVVPDTLRGWGKQARIDAGKAPGTTNSDQARIQAARARGHLTQTR